MSTGRQLFAPPAAAAAGGWLRRLRPPRAATTVAMCVCLALGVLLGLAMDSGARVRSSATLAGAAFERGVEQGRSDMLGSVRGAYQAGLQACVEGLEGAQRGEQGVQLAQTCMAWWYGTQIDKAALRRRVCAGLTGAAR